MLLAAQIYFWLMLAIKLFELLKEAYTIDKTPNVKAFAVTFVIFVSGPIYYLAWRALYL